MATFVPICRWLVHEPQNKSDDATDQSDSFRVDLTAVLSLYGFQQSFQDGKQESLHLYGVGKLRGQQ